MKILLINCVYRIGSTGKIVASISDSLRAKGHKVFTCYGIGEKNVDKYSKKICTDIEHFFNASLSRFTGIPYGGLYFSNYRIKKYIKKFKPDVIHIHLPNASMVNVYSLLKYIAKEEIRTILTLHAEVFHTAGCEHAFECEKWKKGCNHCQVYKQRTGSLFFDRSECSYGKMQKALNSFAQDKLIVTAVSPWLAERAKQSAIIKRYPVVYIPNGVNTSVFHYKKPIGLIDKIGFKKTILFVTPYFGLDKENIKGGYFLPKIAKDLSDCLFVVVASRTAANVGVLPDNIHLWGKAKSQEELAQLYSEADMTLLLSKRETFSMVTAESLCCGTFVVGFKAGGPESIALKEFSHFVEQGDVNAIVGYIAKATDYNSETLSLKATAEYSQDTMVNLFFNIYHPSK